MRALVILGAALALLIASGGLAAGTARADTSVLDMSPSFPAGPYSALYVDRNAPERVAVGTMDGRIAWSENAAERVSETRLRSNRVYDAMAIRGQGKNSSLGSQSVAIKTQRPVRLFIKTLGTGKGITRWQHWRAITAPMTEISQISLPVPGGPMMAVTPAGIHVGDGLGGAFTKTLGAPGTMPNEKVDLVGLSVVANPTDPSFVLAGTTQGVFLSRDGGMNFVPHMDPGIEGEYIFEFLWEPATPDVVLAVGADSILQSEDGGESFAVAYISPSEINSVVVSEMGVFVATIDGLTLVGDGTQNIIEGESIIGVVPWTEGRAIAASQSRLYLINSYGETSVLMRTGDTDPFMKLDGAPGLAFLMSQHRVFRVGAEAERREARNVPVMAMSMSATQQAMLDHLGLGTPEDTRLHPRWYARLVPRVIVDAVAVQGYGDYIMIDHTIPIPFRISKADAFATTEFSILAMWDLSTFVFGDDNASNPDLIIESSLRANRQRILQEVRTRYREAALLAKQLENPPEDPQIAFMWQMRLEEHASYLEFVTGKPAIKEQRLEPTP